MARYEVTFVIDTDLEDVGTQPWWPFIGEEPMPIEWLEYIAVRDLTEDEYVLDVEFEPDTINVVDMTRQEDVIHQPNLQLVVNNDQSKQEDEVEPDETPKE
jgi:hypothetical protein